MSASSSPHVLHAPASLHALGRFLHARPPLPPTSEHCELCGEPLATEHRHLLELARRNVVCACEACALLFSQPGSGAGKYRLIPRRRLALLDFQMTDEQWDELALPVNMAYICYNSEAGRAIAFYPGPAGAMESLLTLENWEALTRANPLLTELEPGVEALLINRVEQTRAYYVVPIDICYRLVGLLRSTWRGLSGGQECRDALATFFEELRARATPTAFPSPQQDESDVRDHMQELQGVNPGSERHLEGDSSMNMEHIQEIARAILYEGYLLYPYRHSALKNRQRWNFGVVYPREYSEANGCLEPWSMRTECLVTGEVSVSLDITVCFLHLLTRSVAQPALVGSPGQSEEHTQFLLTGQLAYEPWEEGRERVVEARNLTVRELLACPRRVEIAFSEARMTEEAAETPGVTIVREQQAIKGAVLIAAERVPGRYVPDLYKISVQIENTTPAVSKPQERRDAILLQAFISTHTILRVQRGNFISLLETPEEYQEAAASCQNVRTWPVLVGEQGQQDAMLSSPIILYDYPQVAPESPGALFDGTEIDEILTLRILTLSDEEKAELRQGDPRVRELLERTEALTPQQLMQLHGTLRKLHPGEDYPLPASISIAGREARVGDAVRLHPKARADAFDMLLVDKTARIAAIQQDFENRLYLVVTLDDDPGREQIDERVMPGHRFFFFPEEVELL